MPRITPISDAQELNLHSAPSSAPGAGKKKVPTAKDLAPWTFKYASSPDGKDMNLLIMFHGLGDNAGPFFQLAKEVNLPSTAILSLQGPLAIPLMETPTYWSWYQTFSPTLNPLPSPSPSPTIPPLRRLIDTLTTPEADGGFGWERRQVHLFGWGQGGSMVLSLARSYGVSGEADTGAGGGGRLGSAISICGGLLDVPKGAGSESTPKAQTPIAFFTRKAPSSAAFIKETKDIQDAFSDVQILRPPSLSNSKARSSNTAQTGSGDGMLKGQDEWIQVMRFWAANLSRDDSGAMRGMGGEGEVYEVR